ncbi:hypothetical protein D3C87_1723620 [compost metagenome]
MDDDDPVEHARERRIRQNPHDRRVIIVLFQECDDPFDNFLLLPRIEARKGAIEDVIVGLADQRPCEIELLPLEWPEPLAAGAEVEIQTHRKHTLIDALLAHDLGHDVGDAP